jgi:hypothetical protein
MVAGLERDAQFQSFASVKRMDGKYFNGIRLPPNAHCSPERRYVIQPQLTASDWSESSIQRLELQDKQRQEPFVDGILDSFTCFCMGGQKRREEKGNTKKSSTSKKSVVYPIASYPTRLNSKRLVDQRRQSLQRQNLQQHFFRPVPEDEFHRLKTRH